MLQELEITSKLNPQPLPPVHTGNVVAYILISLFTCDDYIYFKLHKFIDLFLRCISVRSLKLM